jgi:uncharacterized damage-inducible protein DinB
VDFHVEVCILPTDKEVSEINTYQQRIKDLNTQVCDFVHDIPAEGLNWRPDFKDINSLAALASHIAGAQRFWIREVIGQQAITHQRVKEFHTVVITADQLIEDISATFITVEDILNNLSAVDLGEMRQVEDQQVPIRWGLVHVIDHTALHFGQMQLMYQFWTDGQSKPSPKWNQRHPS